MAEPIRIIKHEAVPNCGSFEVRFTDGRPSRYFYWDDLPTRRLQPEILTREQALNARLPVYRMATLLVFSNAGSTCRWGNAQVVITKAVWVHRHSEPSTALSVDFGRVMATDPWQARRSQTLLRVLSGSAGKKSWP
jgi:hypothetical protein